jgi:hypothetical protein
MSLDLVEKECPTPFLEYVECVDANPRSWQSVCEKQVGDLH